MSVPFSTVWPMTRATSSFTMDDTQHTPTEWAGGMMSRTRFVKTFDGDLAGSGIVEAVMLRTDDDGPAAYVGVERIEGTLHGRTGCFLLLHSATALGGDQVASWTIVPGSGTGALSGISGRAQITEHHDFVLDYSLDSPA